MLDATSIDFKPAGASGTKIKEINSLYFNRDFENVCFRLNSLIKQKKKKTRN